MKSMKKVLFIGVAAIALISVVSLTGCKSKEEKAADAVNSVINNVVENMKGN